MRVCLKAPDHLSRGIHRVARALETSRPAGLELVQAREEAELVVYHVIGLTGLRELVEADRDAGRRYAIVQYCLLTTEDSRPEAWLDLWRGAAGVWSYYNLEAYLTARTPGFRTEPLGVRFYFAPLGVDGTVFQPARPTRKRFVIGTSGYVAETEGVKECYRAAVRVDREQFHLGPYLELGPGVTYVLNVTDAEVAEMWSACTYVAGLRRVEGFELPALEGLACGSRPIVFDAPHYRTWFGEHAEYIPEASADEVVEALVQIFSRPARPVTPAERESVVARFDWRVLAGTFWECIL